MEFGSKFVFNYSDSEEEIVSDDEFEEGLTEDAYDTVKPLPRPLPLPPTPLTTSPAPPAPAGSAERSGGLAPTEYLASVPVDVDASYNESDSSADETLGTGIQACRAMSEDVYDVPSRVRREAAVSDMEMCPAGTAGRGPPPPCPPTVTSSHHRNRRSKSEPMKKTKKSQGKSHHWELNPSQQKYENVKGRKYRRADTNVVSVKFGHLTSAGNMHTGDPVYCNGCGAVLSTISNLTDHDQEKLWKCEYCMEENMVDIMEEEVPNKDDITFMLLPAPTMTAGGKSGLDEMLVVFCVDVSGSMCVTTEVPGKVKLRGDHLSRLQNLNTERENQFLPGQRTNTTYVSRLQGVQAAVDYQLAEMTKDHPSRRVLLITFNSEVTSIGDGSGSPVHLSGDKLRSWDEMKTCGTQLELPQAVKQSRKTLADKLFDLEEGGQTALGPALLLSVSVASRVAGSKVIMCTDGMANIGLGSLDNINNEGDFQDASTFYQNVSQLACENGVAVSVTTIKGTDCKLMELGQVASNTQGQVNIVDPLKLTQEFGNILADATIATNVEATLVLHKGLYFRNEDSSTSKVTRQIGNVNKDTEITFEYGVRRRPKKKNKKTARLSTIQAGDEPMDTTPAPDTEKPSTVRDDPASSEGLTGATASSETSANKDFDISKMDALPFQVQIRYTDTDGGKAMRVLTQTKPLTKDRNEAEKQMNPVLIGVHAAQVSAHMALEGDYTPCRLTALTHRRLFARNMDVADDAYGCYLDQVRPMENAILGHQQRERATKGRTYSDSSNDSSDEEAPEPKPMGRLSALFGLKSKNTRKPKKVKASRHMEVEDSTANMIYANRTASSSSAAWKKN